MQGPAVLPSEQKTSKDDRQMSDVAERVKKIVVEHLGVDAEKVKAEASFIDDLGADSLDTVELVMAFEEEFGIEIPDDAAETIQTVGDAVKFISDASNFTVSAPSPAGVAGAPSLADFQRHAPLAPPKP